MSTPLQIHISIVQSSFPGYLTITNFVNNGNVIGTEKAQLYCAHGAGTHWDSTDYRNTYLVPKNAELAQVVTGSGRCGKLGIDGFAATYNKTTKLISITKFSDDK